MTEERKNLLVEVLNEDLEFTKMIIQKGPDAMTEALKEKGYDFSKDEVIELGELFKEVSAKCINDDGEIDEEMLEQVSGGCSDTAKGIIGIIIFIGLGIAVGY